MALLWTPDQIQQAGVAQGAATVLNFTGAGVTASVTGGVATINISGASVGAATTSGLGTVQLLATPLSAGAPLVPVEDANSRVNMGGLAISNLLGIYDTTGTPVQRENWTAAAGNTSKDAYAATGAGNVAHIFDTNVAYSTAGALIASFKTGGTQKLSIDYTGNVLTTGNIQTSSAAATIGSTGSGASPLTIASAATNSGTSVACVINNTVSMSTAGGLLLSVRNNGTQKASIDYNGVLTLLGGITAGGGVVPSASASYNLGSASAGWYSAYLTNGVLDLAGNARLAVTASSSTTVLGAIADGATNVAVILNNSVTMSTAGAKLLSVRNNGTEKASIDYAGNFSGGTVNGITLFAPAYGSLNILGNATSQTSNGTGGNWNQWTTGWASGVSAGTTLTPASGQITVTNAGTYLVTFSGDAQDSSATGVQGWSIYINGALVSSTQRLFLTTSAGFDYPVCISYMATFAASTTIQVWFNCNNASNTIVLKNAQLNVVRIA